METYTIKVRAVQEEPVLGDIEHNFQIAETAINNATAHGVDLLVFPELFLTGYSVGTLNTESIVEKSETAIDRLKAASSNITVVIGTVTRKHGTLYNSAVVLDDNERVGTYDKTHLYGDEPSVFGEGSSLPVFDTSVGSIGVQICYDTEFPEVARQLTLAGADILVTPLANMRPFRPDQQVFAAARALENIRPHIVCNRIGHEQGIDFFGASEMIDERGQSILSAGVNTAIELTASVEIHAQGADTLEYLNNRRPKLYEEDLHST